MFAVPSNVCTYPTRTPPPILCTLAGGDRCFISYSQLSTPYEKALGLATQATAAERLQALTGSAIAVQRAARVLIARGRVSKVREAIAALQSFCRGCRARWAVSATLEETLRARSRPRLTSPGGVGEDNTHGGEDNEPATSLLPLRRGGAAEKKAERSAGCDASLQIGRVTRRNALMEAGCPEGFRPPNLAAFLWESLEEAYGPGFDAEDADDEKQSSSRAPHSESDGRRRYGGGYGDEDAGSSGSDDEDGAVFELSATVVVASSAFRRRNKGNAMNATMPVSHRPDAPLWTPAAVAPQESLERALRCSTLIVNSPSFGSACARRLFSRIGQPQQPASSQRGHDGCNNEGATDCPRTTPPAVSNTRKLSQPHAPQLEVAERAEEKEGRSEAVCSAQEEEKGRGERPPRRLQGDGLRHILLVGESPIGDGGLSELSSVIRCGCLPRLTTLILGGPGCRVGPRGVQALAMALSSRGCSRLRNLVSVQMNAVKCLKLCLRNVHNYVA